MSLALPLTPGTASGFLHLGWEVLWPLQCLLFSLPRAVDVSLTPPLVSVGGPLCLRWRVPVRKSEHKDTHSWPAQGSSGPALAFEPSWGRAYVNVTFCAETQAFFSREQSQARPVCRSTEASGVGSGGSCQRRPSLRSSSESHYHAQAPACVRGRMTHA